MPLGGEGARAADVDRAPDAARAARREADRVALVIQALADTVDPAEAQGCVHRLGPGDARRARAALVEAHQQLRGAAVMPTQPGTKRGRSAEEFRLHGRAQLHRLATSYRVACACPLHRAPACSNIRAVAWSVAIEVLH